MIAVGSASAHAQSAHGELSFALGVVALEEGRFEDATGYLTQVLEDNPEHASALHYLSVAQRGAGELEDATLSLRRLLRMEPGHTEARRDLAVALLNLDRLREATRVLGSLVEARSEDAEAWYLLGLAHFRSGRMALAVAVLERARELAEETDPIAVAAVYYRGQARLRLGQREEALSDLESVKRLAPHSPLALSVREKPVRREAVEWRAYGSVLSEYDSNVALFADAARPPEGDDVRFALEAGGGARVPLGRAWDVVVQGSVYKSFHALDHVRTRGLDLWHVELDLSGRYFLRGGATPWFLALDYSGSADFVRGGPEAQRVKASQGPLLFGHDHRVGPRLAYWIGTLARVEVGYQVDRAKFDAVTAGARGDERRDFLGHRFYASWLQRGGGGLWLARLAFRAENADGAYRDLAAPSVLLAADFPVAFGVSLEPVAQAELLRFLNRRDSGRMRSDIGLQLGVAAHRLFGDKLEGAIGYAFVRNFSSLDAFDYTRHLLMLSVTAAWEGS